MKFDKNGLLLIDKPSGITSHDVVSRVRKALGTRQVGHAGTLDPLATGLLVIMVNEGTKLSRYYLSEQKEYSVQITLGLRTDSFDTDGTIQERYDGVLPNRAKILEIISILTGTHEFAVPIYSAVKVDGRRLYELAHKGERMDSPPVRAMSFFDIELKSYEGNIVHVCLRVGKGAFVRTWVEEFGKALGCGAVVSGLRRLTVPPFQLDDALSLEELERRVKASEMSLDSNLGAAWVAMGQAVGHLSPVRVSGRDEHLLKNGQLSRQLRSELLRNVPLSGSSELAPVAVLSSDSGRLVAILEARDHSFYKVGRVFTG